MPLSAQENVIAMISRDGEAGCVIGARRRWKWTRVLARVVYTERFVSPRGADLAKARIHFAPPGRDAGLINSARESKIRVCVRSLSVFLSGWLQGCFVLRDLASVRRVVRVFVAFLLSKATIMRTRTYRAH